MRKQFWVTASVLSIITAGCNNTGAVDSGGYTDPAKVITSVTIANGAYQTLKDSIVLRASSTYLLSADIKTNINGYINNVKLQLGDPVNKGQTLFIMQTKESKSLGNTIDKLDSSFKFSGISTIKSTASGYITMLNHQVGDYVQDGDILARITDKNSFGFILNMPFEYRKLIHMNQHIDLELPDKTKVVGFVSRIMPQMDSISQTQQVFVRSAMGNVPSGLIATVVLTKDVVSGYTLPKECIYTDDSQQHFWVMKLINDSTVVKTPIIKSFENSTRVVLSSPFFSLNDRFVKQGGYGLPDTAKVVIQ